MSSTTVVAVERSSAALQLETPACDLCGSHEQKQLFIAQDRRYENAGEFPLVECERCTLRFVSPRPIAATISSWYPASYAAHRKRTSFLRRLGDFFEDKLWNSYLRIFLSRSYPIFYFPRHVPDLATEGRAPRLLDIGCGSGDKLRYIARHSRWQTYGTDFSPQAVENASARGAGDIRLRAGHALPFEDGFFDAVMSWHSLEHHFSPRATMTETARVLRPGGYGIFAVPSGDSIGLRVFRSFWGPLEVPRHLYYFTERTMRRLLQEVGLEVVRVSYDFSFYGLYLQEEIFESLLNVLRGRVGWPSVPLQVPLRALRFAGLVSSVATLPILPLNWLLGRLWRGTNMIVHFRKKIAIPSTSATGE